MQEHPLTVYGVPFILFPKTACPLKHPAQQNITCLLTCLSQQNIHSQLPEKQKKKQTKKKKKKNPHDFTGERGRSRKLVSGIRWSQADK